MKRKSETRPRCQRCGKTGAGVQFKVFSPHGFGTYCVPCEAIVDGSKPEDCACVIDCHSCSHSGDDWHQHEDDPCSVHPDAVMV